MQPCFLFAYPIEPYFSPCLEMFHLDSSSVDKLYRIIDERYRKQGYDIASLFCSEHGNPKKADLSLAPDYFHLEGRVLASGVSFCELWFGGVYPDTDFILDQLPSHSRLVIGGFHQWDCVDKIAERSYQRGVDTFVDQDTTELFFGTSARIQGIPLAREHLSLQELCIPKLFRNYAWEQRKGKPWFVQR